MNRVVTLPPCPLCGEVRHTVIQEFCASQTGPLVGLMCTCCGKQSYKVWSYSCVGSDIARTEQTAIRLWQRHAAEACKN